MNKIISWFRTKNNLFLPTISRKDFIESLIVQRQLEEFSSCLRHKTDGPLCIDAFFRLLPTIVDDHYMSDLFELISKSSRLTSQQLSTIIVKELSRAILGNHFDLCERILYLPIKSVQISLPTYETIQLIHRCSNKDQLIQFLSIIIEKNLPYDSEYFLWILMIIFEHYTLGDEIIIEHLLSMKKNVNLLFSCYGNNNITPLMLFFHLYGNSKCQILIDDYLSNINDRSVLLQCDKWNRSYLMHLLCGQCQHERHESSSETLPHDISDFKQALIRQCPNAQAVLSTFSMLYQLGNKCDKPTQMILVSQYCLPLRVLLFNFLLENDPLIEYKLVDFLMNFPSQDVPNYSNYIKRLIHNCDLDSTLPILLMEHYKSRRVMKYSIEFLLKQGARIDDMSKVYDIIIGLLCDTQSTIPFLLIDYSLHIDIPIQKWSDRRIPMMGFYICRVIQCGYRSEVRSKFDEFKTTLPTPIVKSVEEFIDLKNPPRLSKLCLQKLRNSLKHLGDETIDQLKDCLPNRLTHSIRSFGHEESSAYYQAVIRS